MRVDVTRRENISRHALAIAIVKRQKDVEAQVAQWRTRAERAESDVETLKSALRQFDADPENCLETLPTLQPLDPNTLENNPQSSSILDDLHQHQSTLEVFLRNVHALRTAQV